MGETARARSAVIHVFPVLSDSSAETAEHAENCLTWFFSAALCLGGKPLSTDYGRMAFASAGNLSDNNR
jgi:hypothetical protein